MANSSSKTKSASRMPVRERLSHLIDLSRNVLRHVIGFVYSTLRNPYDTLEKPARSIKILLQMFVGVLVVFSMGSQINLAWLSTHSVAGLWAAIDEETLLDIVGDSLLIATAIELGYLLFTDGPDEAINPLLTALAAAFLLRIPTTQTLSSDDGQKRAIELVIYVVLLAVLLWLRTRLAESERKRKEAEALAKLAPKEQTDKPIER